MKSLRSLPALGVLMSAYSLFSNPSGLNIIPTADVTPQGTVVFQAFTDLGNEIKTDF